MDAELAALASSGATTLVGAMVSDAWAQVRDRVAGYFGRGGEPGADPAVVAGELDAARAELTAARQQDDAAAVADVEAEWRARLRRLLRADPGAADRLRALLDEVAPLVPGPATTVVHNVVRNSISGRVQYGPVVQGQHFSNLTFHAPAPVPPPSSDEETA